MASMNPIIAQRSTTLPKRTAFFGCSQVGKSSLFDRICTFKIKSSGNKALTSYQKGILRYDLNQASNHDCAKARHCQSCKTKPLFHLNPVENFPLPEEVEILDMPGVCSLFADGAVESMLREKLIGNQFEQVVVVLDAKNLRRSLVLALQLTEFGLPMVLNVNMVDEAEFLGIQIDDKELARSFGVPIGKTMAVNGRGIKRLSELLLDAQSPKNPVNYPDAIRSALQEIQKHFKNSPIPPQAMALLLLMEEPIALNWIQDHLNEHQWQSLHSIIDNTKTAFSSPLRVVITSCIHIQAEQIAERAIYKTKHKRNFLTLAGRLAHHPFYGSIIAVVVIVLAFLWIGSFAATWLVDTIQATLFQGFLIPLLDSAVSIIPSAFVRDAIMDPNFGLLPSGVFLALGIVLPVLAAFYLFHGLLEDAGYLPRLAILFDRLFRKIGLNGRALIPLVLGFSCVTMAVITTRTLPKRKERIILTLLLCMGIPCAPLLAVMIVILGTMPISASLVVFGIISIQILLAGYLASRFIKGHLSDLIMEIPPMRIPRFKKVIEQTWQQTWCFVKEAIPIFLLASFLVFLFEKMGGLTLIESSARPLTHGLLGLPDQSIQVLIKTAIRRENGATELKLLQDQFSNAQLVIALLVMTFLIPCVNTVFVVIKERSIKIAFLIFFTAISTALVMGSTLNLIFKTFGINFS